MGEKGKKKLPLDTTNVPSPLHPHPLLDRDRSLAEGLGQNGVSQQTNYSDPLLAHPGHPGFFVPQLHGASRPFTESFWAGAGLPSLGFLGSVPPSSCITHWMFVSRNVLSYFTSSPQPFSPHLCGFPEEAAISPLSTHQLQAGSLIYTVQSCRPRNHQVRP